MNMNNEDECFEPEFVDNVFQSPINRREFLKITASGIIVLFTLGDTSVLAQQRRLTGRSAPADLNAYLRIGEDGRVTCFTGKVELGQGVITSLAQMLADELDMALETVDMLMGDTELCPFDRGTFGSMTTRFFGPPLRAAGAEARSILLELASEYLEVPKDRLIVKNGVVSDKSKPQNHVSYAQLTKGKKITRQLGKEAQVKNPSEFTIIGKPAKRADALEKVTGKAQYAGDVQLPGMLYARILRPTAHGATLKNIDIAPAQKINGVQVVQDGDLVAVLHKYPDVAEHALAQIKAEYDKPPANVDDKTIFQHLLSTAPRGSTAAEGGNLTSGESQSSITAEETYLNSYVAHAPIEPHTAVAKIEGDKVMIWASTQTPFGLKSAAANTLGVSADNVHVIAPFVGGGFGGKNSNQQGIEAVRLAKLTGKPVQVAWTREEEFMYDTFRPAAIVKIKSGVTQSGKLALWDYQVYFAGSRGAEQFYNIPNHRTVVYGSNWGGAAGTHPFATGPWRAPANNTNTFARESQIEVMAAKAGIDPLEFRLNNLTDQKMVRVLKAAAEKFGWTPSKAPSGRGFGIACGIDSGTYVATMAEVEVDKKTGHVQVKRVVCAQDMGLAVNPEGAKLQMEGCITMGLGYALTEEIHFKGGEILDLNFGTYELPRFSWLPKIETVLIEDKESPAQGGGEPPIICMGGVIANAIYDAIGVRLLQLPMTAERIKEQMTKA
jgi:nicotinate dehydrogenase subunit B